MICSDPERVSDKEKYNLLHFLAYQDNPSQLSQSDKYKLEKIIKKLINDYNCVSPLSDVIQWNVYYPNYVYMYVCMYVCVCVCVNVCVCVLCVCVGGCVHVYGCVRA